MNDLNKTVNTIISAIIFVVAAYMILMTTQPLLIKTVLVVVAYFFALHWMNDYMPRTARFLAKFSVLLVFEIITAVLSLGGGHRR